MIAHLSGGRKEGGLVAFTVELLVDTLRLFNTD